MKWPCNSTPIPFPSFWPSCLAPAPVSPPLSATRPTLTCTMRAVTNLRTLSKWDSPSTCSSGSFLPAPSAGCIRSSRAIIALEGPGQRKGNQSDWSKAPSFPWEQKTISLFRLKAGLFFYIILLLKKRTTENSSFIHPHSTDSQKFSQKRQLTNTRKRDSI